jgi:hypothetical protein
LHPTPVVILKKNIGTVTAPGIEASSSDSVIRVGPPIQFEDGDRFVIINAAGILT